ncbi:hypothetical protein [Paraburkholderia domus]|uniref:hypothetical protein n=1 Tax=Paraburkholderia domus TaxID=2793075 RepID=UPI001914B329|nr:hypothetical protein [Paraburkholderia domus]MBK5061843.1 hypothetical protein [Burkholderia sp. R-70199]CAE6901504.1 hypothetical protein R70199_03723 [Paraburkholderia domus]
MTTLQNSIDQFTEDAGVAHEIVHGDANTVVTTEGGPVRSFAKLIADNQAEISEQAELISPIANGTSTDAGTLTGAEALPTSRGAGLLQTTPAAISQYGQTGFQWPTSAAAGARSRTSKDRSSDVLSVLEFCVGDGVADDTVGLYEAELQAFATGKSLLFPYGTIVKYNGQFTPRVHVWGYGAKLLQASNVITQSATLSVSNLTDVQVVGLTIDGGGAYRGLVTNSCTSIRIIDVTAQNCVGMAFGHYVPTDLLQSRTRAKTITYGFSVTPTAGGSADGVYIAGGLNARVVDCRAEDFCRIGFVSEQNGTLKSSNVTFEGCYAKYGHDCDQSTTEYNAGFWAEDTNSGAFIDCWAENIASGVGQTSNRVTAFVIGAGQGGAGTQSIQGCRTFGNTNVLSCAYSVKGVGNLTTLIMQQNYAENANQGVYLVGGFASASIEDMTLASMVYATDNHGGIVVNAGSTTLPNLSIARLNTVPASNTYAGHSADINIIASPSGAFNLRDCRNGSISVVHQFNNWLSVNVNNCALTHNDASYGAFRANALNINGESDISLGANSNGYINYVPVLTSGAQWSMRGGTVTAAALITTELGGVSVGIDWNSVRFTNVTYKFSTTGTYVHRFNACSFSGFGTLGAIYWGYANVAASELYVQHCRFNSSDPTIVPVQKWNYSPAKGIVDASNSTNSNALTNLSGISTSPTFNNVTTGGLNTSGTLQFGTSAYLYSDVANSVSQRNGTGGQTWYGYGTYTDPSNYERGKITINGGMVIGTEQAGTGLARGITFVTGGTARWQIFSSGSSFAPATDGGASLGASGQSVLHIWQKGVLVNSGTGYAVPGTNATVTVGAASNLQIVDPTTAIANLSIQFPTPLGDGHAFNLIITQAITTALTLLPNTGATISSRLVSGAATTGYQTAKFRYYAAKTAWYQEG